MHPGTPLSFEDARRLVKAYVEHYNDVRLNRAIDCIKQKDMLVGGCGYQGTKRRKRDSLAQKLV